MFFPIYTLCFKNIKQFQVQFVLLKGLFQNLEKFKNKFRTIRIQDNLTAFMVLASDNDILKIIHFENMITEFAKCKARKTF